MKRPSFQFYPGDWLGNTNLRRCSHAEKGIWLDVMCLMHDADQYGVLRWPLIDIASAIGCDVSTMQSLVGKGVIKGDDILLDEPYVHVRYASGKMSAPIVLIPAQPGPVWFSSRMVLDEYHRMIRAEGGKLGAEHGIKGKEFGALGGRPRGDKNPPSRADSNPPIKPPPSSSSPSTWPKPPQPAESDYSNLCTQGVDSGDLEAF